MSVEILKNKNLAKFSYYGIGGNADEIWRISDVKSLSETWGETFVDKIPRIILGAGSNCVFSDLGFRGRVFVFTGNKHVWQKNIVNIEAGESLQKVVENFAKNGWADLENLSGIPGTLGGAIRGNAGAHGAEISDKIMEVEYIDESGMVCKIPRKNCEFDYRTSIFKKNPNWLITRATFQLTEKGESEKIIKEAKEQFIKRVDKNPAGRSGGSFFKNPPDNFAGKLLDEAGAKGDRIGEAEISEKHANFLLNKGKATQNDILKLAKKWQTKVREKFGIKLEPEVVLLDEYGKLISLDSLSWQERARMR